MAISDAHDGQIEPTPDSSPRRAWFTLNWSTHWPTCLMSINSILVLVEFGVTMLGVELDSTGNVVTGAVVFMVAAVAWIFAGIAVFILIVWAGIVWFVSRVRR